MIKYTKDKGNTIKNKYPIKESLVFGFSIVLANSLIKSIVNSSLASKLNLTPFISKMANDVSLGTHIVGLEALSVVLIILLLPSKIKDGVVVTLLPFPSSIPPKPLEETSIVPSNLLYYH